MLLNHRLYNQVRNEIHTKMHIFRIQLRGPLRKQMSKEPGLVHYEGWGPIRDQVQEQVSHQLKQNIVL